MTCTVPPIKFESNTLEISIRFCKHSFCLQTGTSFSEATDLQMPAVNTCDMKLFHHSVATIKNIHHVSWQTEWRMITKHPQNNEEYKCTMEHKMYKKCLHVFIPQTYYKHSHHLQLIIYDSTNLALRMNVLAKAVMEN